VTERRPAGPDMIPEHDAKSDQDRAGARPVRASLVARLGLAGARRATCRLLPLCVIPPLPIAMHGALWPEAWPRSPPPSSAARRSRLGKLPESPLLLTSNLGRGWDPTSERVSSASIDGRARFVPRKRSPRFLG
jgi:hypothetical protein